MIEKRERLERETREREIRERQRETERDRERQRGGKYISRTYSFLVTDTIRKRKEKNKID